MEPEAMAAEVRDRWERAFTAAADPARAVAMAAYMREVAPFFGLGAPERRRLAREGLTGLPALDVPGAVALADACWERPQRELHYAAIDEVARAVHRDPARHAPEVLALAERVCHRVPWWDTVDPLSRKVVGDTVRARPDLGRPVVERWLGSPSRWLVRTALLHQGRWGEDMDGAFLFAAALRQAAHDDFFVRKAIGWALRDYAHLSADRADEVRAFLAGEGRVLSALSAREALRRVRH